MRKSEFIRLINQKKGHIPRKLCVNYLNASKTKTPDFNIL